MTIIMVPWRVKRKIGRIRRENGCKIIADNLKKADWSWGCAATVDYEGRTIWNVDAHRDDDQRFTRPVAKRFKPCVTPRRTPPGHLRVSHECRQNQQRSAAWPR